MLICNQFNCKDMNNPVVYFTITRLVNGDKSFLRPVRSYTELSKRFNDKTVQEDNIRFYNLYTAKFIKAHGDSGEFFKSSEYDFNPELCIFNFKSIQECNDSDYDKMQYPSSFDITKEYHADNSKRKTLLDKISDEHPCPSIESGFYVEERNWNYLVRNILRHKNTMLIGPTGTGKTEIVQKICAELGLECHIYDMGSMQDPLTDLLGSHRLENGSSVFDYAKFVEDVQKPGVILLDELSRAPLMTNNILFPCLDGRRQLPIEIADSHHDRAVKVHPECTFIATANIGSEYSGTNEIDAALLNRFLPIQLNYLPANIEIRLLNIRTGIDDTAAAEIVSKFNAIRMAYNENTISKSVSTRELIACGELIADGFTIAEAIDFIVCQKFVNAQYDTDLVTVKRLVATI